MPNLAASAPEPAPGTIVPNQDLQSPISDGLTIYSPVDPPPVEDRSTFTFQASPTRDTPASRTTGEIRKSGSFKIFKEREESVSTSHLPAFANVVNYTDSWAAYDDSERVSSPGRQRVMSEGEGRLRLNSEGEARLRLNSEGTQIVTSPERRRVMSEGTERRPERSKTNQVDDPVNAGAPFLKLALQARAFSVCPSVCRSVGLSVRPSVRPSVRLSVCLSVCLSVRLSVCLSVCSSYC